MVLAELGQKVTKALASLNAAPVIDEAVLDACLKEIAAALLQSDVNVRLVANLRNNVKKRVNVKELGGGLNKQRVIEKVMRLGQHSMFGMLAHVGRACATCTWPCAAGPLLGGRARAAIAGAASSLPSTSPSRPPSPVLVLLFAGCV